MENQRAQSQGEPIKNNDQPLDGMHGSSSGTQAETSNTAQSGGDTEQGHRHTSAAQLDALITSPTNAVHARHHSGRHHGDTGTNISYEGATAPGGGGSVGTGEASGQSASGSSITSTDADLTVSGAHHPHSQQQGADEGGNQTGEHNPLQKEHDDNLDRDTVGTP